MKVVSESNNSRFEKNKVLSRKSYLTELSKFIMKFMKKQHGDRFKE